MYIDGPAYRFLAQESDHAPEKPGVFILWHKGALVYVGSHPTSVRQGLLNCMMRLPVREKDKPDYYNFEVTESGKEEQRAAELVAEWFNATRRLPAGNDLRYRFP